MMLTKLCHAARLDFTFAITQPNSETICDVDSFEVKGGASNQIPILCGDSNGQHSKLPSQLLFFLTGSQFLPNFKIFMNFKMLLVYVDVSRRNKRSDDLYLLFQFGQSKGIRSWDFNIAFLPCGESYLGINVFF